MQATDVRTVYASGTAYSLTDTSAALDFGTTDPAVVLRQLGSYLLIARATMVYTAATTGGNKVVTLKLRRTNNTAADVTGATTSIITDSITTTTAPFGSIDIPSVIYTTTNSDDSITIFGDVSVAPAAGSIDITESEIIAIKLY